MKIAITTDAIYPFTLGGSEIRNHEIAKRLVKNGHEIHIYGGKFWEGENVLKIDGIFIHGVYKYSKLCPGRNKRKVAESLMLSLNIFLQLLKQDYDIIDNSSFNFFNCYSVKLASLIKKRPLIFTWHQYFGNYLIGYFGFIGGIIAMALERTSIKLAKNNIAVSNHVKSKLIKRGLSKNFVTVITNGADIKKTKNAKSNKKKYHLIFIGRLTYQKNLEFLIHSIALIKNTLPKIKLALIGEGDDEKKLISLTKKLGLKNNIDFAGRIPEKEKVFSYLKSAKIFVLTSRLEGFPLTMIEANACGLPVVATGSKLNNISEYIKNNENGLLTPPCIESFSKTVLKLLSNEKLLKSMAKNGIKKSADYDWDIIAGEQEKYYFRIMSHAKDHQKISGTL